MVSARIARIRGGNFGNSKSLGSGVFEFKIDYGPGYRIYYGKRGETVVILLCVGDKSTQKRDVKTAKEYWEDCLKNSHGRKK